MKKSIFIIGCLALLMAGCNKVEKVEVPAEAPAVESLKHLIVDLKVNQEGDTRSVKTSWEAGDKIYVFFDHFFLDYLTDPDIGSSYSDDVEYLTLTYDGSAWQYAITPALEKYLLGQTSGSLAAIYISDTVPNFRALHMKRGNTESFFVDVHYSVWKGIYLYDDNCDYSIAYGKLSATLSMHPSSKSVHFFVPGLTKVGGYDHYLQCEQLGSDKLNALGSDNVNGAGFGAPVVSLETSNSSITPTYYPDGAGFCARFKNSNYPGTEMEYVIKIIDHMATPENTDDVCYTLTKTATINGKDAIELPPLSDPKWVRSFVNPVTVKGFYDNREWVMMADGKRWSTINVGATDAKDPGSRTSYMQGILAMKEEWGGENSKWTLPTLAEWMAFIDNPNHEATLVYEEVDGEQVCVGVQVKALADVNDGVYYYNTAGNKVFFPIIEPYNDGRRYGTYWAYDSPDGIVTQGYYVLFQQGGEGRPPMTHNSTNWLMDRYNGAGFLRPILNL